MFVPCIVPVDNIFTLNSMLSFRNITSVSPVDFSIKTLSDINLNRSPFPSIGKICPIAEKENKNRQKVKILFFMLLIINAIK